MSVAELKERVAELSAQERFELAAFLAELEETQEAEFRAEAGRRMQAMDRGAKVTMEEFEERDRKLRANGR